jgi:xanthine dehydrogenase small subunit
LKVVSPRNVKDALVALRDAGPDARVLAGGTDLMVEFEAGRTRPDLVVDVWRLEELRGIRDEQGGVRIGALATCTDLLRSSLVAQRADILVAAVREFAALQIRNRATLGGNLGTASPAADLNPVLFALGARVRLVSERGLRELPVASFVTGYRANARARDELIESVFVPARPSGERRGFRKVGTRRAQSISKVVVAVATVKEDGIVRSVVASAGSVADRTLLLPSVERALVGTKPTPESISAGARAAARDDCAPRTDVRSTADYRRAVTARVLHRLIRGARGW